MDAVTEEALEVRRLIAEQATETKRWWSGTATALAAMFLATAAACIAISATARSQQSQVSHPADVEMAVVNQACMAQCPAHNRRLKDNAKELLENCLRKCPSSGFRATMTFEQCKAQCERAHPLSDGMASIPASGPPMEGCEKDCFDRITGNFWKVRYQRCAGKCAINTAADEVVFQTKHNISMPEMKDLETQVVSVLKKRIIFQKRPDDHPFSFLIFQCRKKAEDALGKALGIPAKHSKPAVVIRPFKPGVHHVGVQALNQDPGNDLEAVVDVQALSNENMDKLADDSTLKSFDKAFDDAISSDTAMHGLLKIFPAEAAEVTSASVSGNFVSLGWHTVCRRDKADHTMNGFGTTQVVHHETLNSCSQMCTDSKTYCYGFEYRAHQARCELWTQPICHHEEANVQGATFVDFRCFKRCQ